MSGRPSATSATDTFCPRSSTKVTEGNFSPTSQFSGMPIVYADVGEAQEQVDASLRQLGATIGFTVTVPADFEDWHLARLPVDPDAVLFRYIPCGLMRNRIHGELHGRTTGHTAAH